MGIGATDNRSREAVRPWVRLGFYTGYETLQYAVIIVFLGVVTTVADQGALGTTQDGTPVLVDIIDVAFVSTAVGTNLGTQSALMVMIVAIVTLATMTGVGLPVLHRATVPVYTPQREYVFTLPDLTVFGIDIDPFLVAVPVLVLVTRVALTGTAIEGYVPPRTLLQSGVVTGIVHTITILGIAVIAREILLAFLTAIAGSAATAGVTVTIISIPIVAVVAGFSIVFAVVGLTLGLAARSVDLQYL